MPYYEYGIGYITGLWNMPWKILSVKFGKFYANLRCKKAYRLINNQKFGPLSA